MNFFISDESEVLGATILMTLALIAALVTSKRRTGLLLTPVTVFFLFAFVHVLFGRYAAAVLTDEYSFVSRVALGPFLDQSFLVISTGLTCCLLGFTLFPCASPGGSPRRLARISCKRALGPDLRAITGPDSYLDTSDHHWPAASWRNSVVE